MATMGRIGRNDITDSSRSHSSRSKSNDVSLSVDSSDNSASISSASFGIDSLGNSDDDGSLILTTSTDKKSRSRHSTRTTSSATSSAKSTATNKSTNNSERSATTKKSSKAHHAWMQESLSPGPNGDGGGWNLDSLKAGGLDGPKPTTSKSKYRRPTTSNAARSNINTISKPGVFVRGASVPTASNHNSTRNKHRRRPSANQPDELSLSKASNHSTTRKQRRRPSATNQIDELSLSRANHQNTIRSRRSSSKSPDPATRATAGIGGNQRNRSVSVGPRRRLSSKYSIENDDDDDGGKQLKNEQRRTKFQNDHPNDPMPSDEILECLYGNNVLSTPPLDDSNNNSTVKNIKKVTNNDINTLGNNLGKMVVKPTAVTREALDFLHNDNDSFNDSGLSFASEFEWKSWKASVKHLAPEAAWEAFLDKNKKTKAKGGLFESTVVEEGDEDDDDDDGFLPKQKDEDEIEKIKRKKKKNPSLDVLNMGKQQGSGNARSVGGRSMGGRRQVDDAIVSGSRSVAGSSNNRTSTTRSRTTITSPPITRPRTTSSSTGSPNPSSPKDRKIRFIKNKKPEELPKPLHRRGTSVSGTGRTKTTTTTKVEENARSSRKKRNDGMSLSMHGSSNSLPVLSSRIRKIHSTPVSLNSGGGLRRNGGKFTELSEMKNETFEYQESSSIAGSNVEKSKRNKRRDEMLQYAHRTSSQSLSRNTKGRGETLKTRSNTATAITSKAAQGGLSASSDHVPSNSPSVPSSRIRKVHSTPVSLNGGGGLRRNEVFTELSELINETFESQENSSIAGSKVEKSKRNKRRDEMSQSAHGTSSSSSMARNTKGRGETLKTRSKTATAITSKATPDGFSTSSDHVPSAPSTTTTDINTSRDLSNKSIVDPFEDPSESNVDSSLTKSSGTFASFAIENDSAGSFEDLQKKKKERKKKKADRSGGKDGKSRSKSPKKNEKRSQKKSSSNDSKSVNAKKPPLSFEFDEAAAFEFESPAFESSNSNRNSKTREGAQSISTREGSMSNFSYESGAKSQKSSDSAAKKKMKKGRRVKRHTAGPSSREGADNQDKHADEFVSGFDSSPKKSSGSVVTPSTSKFGEKVAVKKEDADADADADDDLFDVAPLTIGGPIETSRATKAKSSSKAKESSKNKTLRRKEPRKNAGRRSKSTSKEPMSPNDDKRRPIRASNYSTAPKHETPPRARESEEAGGFDLNLYDNEPPVSPLTVGHPSSMRPSTGRL